MNNKLTIDYKKLSRLLTMQVELQNTITQEAFLFNAIIDTGATNTAISPQVFDKLKLRKFSEADIECAGGKSQGVMRTVINLFLPNKIAFCNIKAPVITLPEGVDALIGMDIIGQCDFLLTNVNKTILQLRSPAVADGVCL